MTSGLLKIFFTGLFFSVHVLVAQQDTLQKRLLASNDSLDVKVLRISKCESHKNNYYVIHKKDSVSLRYTDRCISHDPFEYKESFKLSSRQLNKIGKPELVLECTYSDHDNFEKEILVIDIDVMKIIFRTEIEGRGRHIYGEQLGDFYGYKYDMSFKSNGHILIWKPKGDLNKYETEEYYIVDGKYILLKNK